MLKIECFLTGGPGEGKTTAITDMISSLKGLPPHMPVTATFLTRYNEKREYEVEKEWTNNTTAE